jgi:purine nucleosidase
VTTSLVLDTDGGTDDALALWWALGEPGVELLAVLGTGGNVDRDTAVANAGRVLRAAGREDVPVARGHRGRDPRSPGVHANGTGSRHGPDGLGGTAARWPVAAAGPVAAPADEVLGRVSCLRTGEVDVVALGPLTTLAAALRIDPGLASRLRSLTVMGGSLAPGGRTVGRTEANVGQDPAAAAQVLAAPWATVGPPTLVPLEVTLAAPLTPSDLVAAEPGRTPAARFLAEPLLRYGRRSVADGRVPAGACPCHDLVAVLAAVHPGVVTWADERRLTVEGEPAAPGVPWRVATAVDARRVRSAFHALVGATS